VWIACGYRGEVVTRELRLFGDRSGIKQRAARLALDFVRTTVSDRSRRR
jgi:nicotinamide mononucleotide (NMN) deamidase PncC